MVAGELGPEVHRRRLASTALQLEPAAVAVTLKRGET